MDRDTMRRALVDLRAAVDDSDAVTRDMLKASRERELGPVLHRDNYGEARAKIVSSFAYLTNGLDDDPDAGDPSGNGSGAEY